MTRAEQGSDRRGRGNIRRRGGSLQVRVYSGVDPVTGKEIYLSETVKGTDRAAYRRADVSKLSARNLETLYGELRRCRARCGGSPFIERDPGRAQNTAHDPGPDSR